MVAGVSAAGTYGTAAMPMQGTAARQLSADERKQVERLAETDRKVRAHEQAHIAASGGLAQGGASFSFVRGPDGKSYAVAGEVQIDTSKGKDAAETLARATRIRAAALAPADPSPQDRSVAAAAGRLEAEAQIELRQARAADAGAASETTTAATRSASAIAAYTDGAKTALAPGIDIYA